MERCLGNGRGVREGGERERERERERESVRSDEHVHEHLHVCYSCKDHNCYV
jgi:hypothetical protein